MSVRQHLIAAWGIGGVCLLLIQALLRLTPIALEPIAAGMTAAQWGIWAAWVAANGYMEGYRGFQTRFSPRVVQRAFFLAKHPRPLHVLLAPVFCMSYFYAARRGKIVAWALLAFIVCAVIAIRFIPQPWRGIVDAGVVIGLVWGLVAIVVFWARALVQPPGAPNDLPSDA